jgi:hypothetical protein
MSQAPKNRGKTLRVLTKAGDTVYVTSADGRIRRWTLRDVPLELVMQQAGLSVADVRNIARERADSVWNGTLIGLAVAATPWLIVCAANDWCYYNEYGSENLLRNTALITAAMGAGVGALIDRSIRRQVIIYRSGDTRSLSISVSPTAIHQGTMVRMTATF